MKESAKPTYIIEMDYGEIEWEILNRSMRYQGCFVKLTRPTSFFSTNLFSLTMIPLATIIFIFGIVQNCSRESGRLLNFRKIKMSFRYGKAGSSTIYNGKALHWATTRPADTIAD
jgi:hypothetical protein